jgi:hypothetical protein
VSRARDAGWRAKCGVDEGGLSCLKCILDAAGDATASPIKRGGPAAQQADAVAEVIASSVGAEIDPQPFRPILRGLLRTGGPARYLRADISGEADDDSTISAATLWWPPDKIVGRYLAPYSAARSVTPRTSCPRTSTRFASRQRSTGWGGAGGALWGAV